MAKTKQEELLLQADIVGYPEGHKSGPMGLRGQGFYCEKQSERFKAGRPDCRVARSDLGQLDFELKYVTGDDLTEIDVGMTKLQWLHLKTMNEHGMPAVCLVYLEKPDLFLVTTEMVLHRPLLRGPYACLKLPRPRVIDGVDLFAISKDYLNDRGYKYPRWL